MLGRNIIGFLFAFACTLQVTAQYSSPCIMDCVTQSFSDYGCASSDLECICSDTSFGDLVYACISANCPDDLGSALDDYTSACSGYTTLTYTGYTSESSYSSESSESYSDTSATDYNTTVVYSSSSYPSSGYPSSSYPTPSYSTPSYSGYSSSSSSRPSAPSGYPTVSPTPSVYGVSSSSSTTTTTPSGNNGYGGAAGRNAVLPAAFVTLMAVMVAMAVV